MAVLRFSLSVVAALAVLASTLGALVIWGAFEVQRESIAEHQCENPDSDCDGMCFLSKRMEAHHGHDEGGDAPAAVLTAPTLLAVAPPASSIPADRWRSASDPSGRTGLDPSAGAPGDVFRPPERG